MGRAGVPLEIGDGIRRTEIAAGVFSAADPDEMGAIRRANQHRGPEAVEVVGIFRAVPEGQVNSPGKSVKHGIVALAHQSWGRISHVCGRRLQSQPPVLRDGLELRRIERLIATGDRGAASAADPLARLTLVPGRLLPGTLGFAGSPSAGGGWCRSAW